MYPVNDKFPNGKLRLMYECNPMAFIAEQAGGSGSDGSGRIIQIEPEAPHQRSAFYVGSKKIIKKVDGFLTC
jgi:fructose-1,6-bisphosphatase I